MSTEGEFKAESVASALYGLEAAQKDEREAMDAWLQAQSRLRDARAAVKHALVGLGVGFVDLGDTSGAGLRGTVLRYLRAAEKPCSTREIIDGIALLGYVTDSPHILPTIHTTLKRLARQGLVRKEHPHLWRAALETESMA